MYWNKFGIKAETLGVPLITAYCNPNLHNLALLLLSKTEEPLHCCCLHCVVVACLALLQLALCYWSVLCVSKSRATAISPTSILVFSRCCALYSYGSFHPNSQSMVNLHHEISTAGPSVFGVAGQPHGSLGQHTQGNVHFIKFQYKLWMDYRYRYHMTFDPNNFMSHTLLLHKIASRGKQICCVKQSFVASKLTGRKLCCLYVVAQRSRRKQLRYKKQKILSLKTFLAPEFKGQSLSSRKFKVTIECRRVEFLVTTSLC